MEEAESSTKKEEERGGLGRNYTYWEVGMEMEYTGHLLQRRNFEDEGREDWKGEGEEAGQKRRSKKKRRDEDGGEAVAVEGSVDNCGFFFC